MPKRVVRIVGACGAGILAAGMLTAVATAGGLLTISGVVSQGGSPVSGTTVSYVNSDSTAHVVTDADGAYVLHVQAGTTVTLTFHYLTTTGSTLGFGPNVSLQAQTTAFAVGTQDVTANLTWPTTALAAVETVSGSGTVVPDARVFEQSSQEPSTLSDGEPVSVSWQPGPSSSTCTSGAAGACTFVVPKGYVISYEAEAYTVPGTTNSAKLFGSRSKVVSTDPTTVRIRLYPPSPPSGLGSTVTLSGVVTQAGVPVAGTSVLYRDGGSSGEVLTGTEGTYSLDVPESSTLDLTFFQSGTTLGLGNAGLSASAQLTVTTQSIVANLTWPTPAQAVVAVVTSTGAPDAGVHVSDREEGSAVQGLVQTTIAGGAAVTFGWQPERPTTACTTGATGTCSLTVPKGLRINFTGSISATPGNPSSATTTATITKPIRRNPMDIALTLNPPVGIPPGPTVTVSGVVSQDGVPVAGTDVVFSDQDVSTNTVTGADGSYRVQVPATSTLSLGFRYEVAATGPSLGFSTGTQFTASASVSVGTQDVVANLTWPTPAAADVEVLNGSGAVMAGITVSAYPIMQPTVSLSDGVPVNFNWNSGPELLMCTSNSTGTCTITVPKGTQVAFHASAYSVPGDPSYPRYHITKQKIIATNPTVVHLRFTNIVSVTSVGSVTGSVRASSPTGTSIEDVSVTPTPATALPPGVVDLTGAMTYQVYDVPVGGSITVTVSLPTGSDPTAVYKEVDGAFVNESTIATISGNQVVLHLTDGGKGDADGVANGVIVDPVVFVRGTTGTATTTTLTAATGTGTAGIPVTYTATVLGAASTGAVPTGAVTISDTGGECSGQLAVVDGHDQVSCQITNLAPQTEAVIASYAGDAVYSSSVSARLRDTIAALSGAAKSSVSLSAAPSRPVAGEAVTLTATVSARSGTPAGAVYFADGGVGIPGCTTVPLGADAMAQCDDTSGLGAGLSTLTAAYSGDSTLAGGTSSGYQVAAATAGSTTTVSSGADPSGYDQAVTFTALVAPPSQGDATPAGNVTFSLSDPAPLKGAGHLPALRCSQGAADVVALSGGAAQCTVVGLVIPQSPVTVVATYGGSTEYGSSTSPTFTQTVSKETTAISVVSSGSPLPSEKAVTFTATVSPTGPAGKPTGTVTFTIKGANGAAVSCETSDVAAVSKGSGKAKCKVAKGSMFAANGPYTVVATYSGNTDFAGSTGDASQALTALVTKTKLTVPGGQQGPGSALTLSASVMPSPSSAATPTGSVTFAFTAASGSAPACTGGDNVPISDGTATCVLASGLTALGSPYSVVASYGGDGNDKPSKSATRQIRVKGK